MKAQGGTQAVTERICKAPECASSSTGSCFRSPINKKHAVEESVKYILMCEHIWDPPLPSSIHWSITDPVWVFFKEKAPPSWIHL